jgi:hypothetical protein
MFGFLFCLRCVAATGLQISHGENESPQAEFADV